MPRQKIPQRDFNQLFEQACDDIWAYFDVAYEIAARVREERMRLRQLEDEGKRTRSKGRNVQKIVSLAAYEFDVAYSSASQAKQCGLTFSQDYVEVFLLDCRVAGYVPCRQTFIELASVPYRSRNRFARQVIEHHWNAAHIKQRRIAEFGNRSNGGRRPRPPATLGQAQDQLDRAYSRLETIFDRLRQVQVGVVGAPPGVDFRVPRNLMPQLTACLESLDEIRDALAECGGQVQAA